MYTKQIQIGQRLHCILYGGKDGIVVAAYGEQSPASCKSIEGGIGVMGGNAHFDIVWDNGTQSLKIPEALIRSSVQWRVYDEVVTQTEIDAAWRQLEIVQADKAAQEAIRQAAFSAEKDRLLAAYPQLKLRADEEYDAKRAVLNIRLLLKAQWPKVKFSVRRPSFSTINISWEDGPTQREVDAIVDQFSAGHFDGMQDIYESKITPWTSLFGSADYIFTARNLSDTLTQLGIDLLWQCLPNVKTLAKPTPGTVWNGWVAVPDLGSTCVSELVRAILSAYSAVEGNLVESQNYHQHNWLLSYARRALAGESV